MKVFILFNEFDFGSEERTNAIIKAMPDIEFVKANSPDLKTEHFIDFANCCDLVHFNSYNIKSHLGSIVKIFTPFIYSVCFEKFPPYVFGVASWATKTIVDCESIRTQIAGSILVKNNKAIRNIYNKCF